MTETNTAEPRPVCQACGYPNLPTEMYQTTMEPPLTLCRLCAHTVTGNAVRHPSLYPDRNVLLTLTFCANALLDQLGAFDAWKATHTLIDEDDL